MFSCCCCVELYSVLFNTIVLLAHLVCSQAEGSPMTGSPHMSAPDVFVDIWRCGTLHVSVCRLLCTTARSEHTLAHTRRLKAGHLISEEEPAGAQVRVHSLSLLFVSFLNCIPFVSGFGEMGAGCQHAMRGRPRFEVRPCRMSGAIHQLWLARFQLVRGAHTRTHT